MGSQYVPGHHPPSLWDRVLSHAHTIPIAALLLIFGALILVSAVTPMEISQSLSESHVMVKISVAAPMIAGPPAVIWGALNPGYGLRPLTAMATERAGSIATAAGSAAFAVGIILSGNHLGLSTVLVSGAISTAFLLRVRALWVTERRIRDRLEADTRGG